MEDGLQLNLNFGDDLGAAGGSSGGHRHAKLDWRERKRLLTQQKRNNKRPRSSSGQPGADRRVATPTGHCNPAASTAKRQRVGEQQQQQQVVAPDPLHGYGAALKDSREQQPAQQQQQHDAAGARPPRAGSSNSTKAGLTPKQQAAPNPPRVVKGAVAMMQEAAEAAGVPDGAEDDIAALVAASLGREQQLQAEVGGSHGGHEPAATAAAAGLGVVEFGDVEDEPDYAGLLASARGKKQQQQHGQAGQHKASAAGPGAAAAAPAANRGQHSKHQHQQQQHSQQQQQPLVQHKAGELTHAEPHVPAASRLQLFGPEAVPGVADDSSWAGLGLSPLLAAHLEALNFQEPTQVQKQAIPVLLAGRDALVRSATGSGKTLAYLGPLVHRLAAAAPRITREQGTHGVVLVPTRELAVQVNDVLTALLRRFCWLVPGILIGGEHRGHEKARLRKGVTVLVATPGRLMDHLQNTASFRTDRLAWLVLDEADRLLDLGFEQKLAAIIADFDARSSSSSSSSSSGAGGDGSGSARRARQTVLLSATLHSGLAALAGLSMQQPVAVGFKAELVDGQLQLPAADPAAAGEQQQQGQAGGGGPDAFDLPQQLRQKYVEVPAKMRLVYLIGALQSRLRRSKASKVVVFFSNCDSVEFHHALFVAGVQLAAGGGGGGGPPPADSTGAAAGAGAEPVQLLGGVPVCKLHGDMPQPERTSALVTFAKAKACVLLCTDVAARGLDFPAVSTIIQYDPAGDPAEYVHRVGRTARMGQHGEALLFLLPSELQYAALLQQRGMQLAQEAAPDLLRTLPALLAGEQAGGGGGGKPGGVLRLARKLQAEAAAAAQDGKHAAGGGKGSALSAQRAEQLAASMLLQRQMLLAISADVRLRQMALDAFRSYVRAYATHPSGLKHVFHVKSLHLGHLAASFGLREAPARIGSSGSSAERKKRKAAAGAAAKKREKAAWHRTARAAAADGA